MKTILLADHHALMREGLALVLSEMFAPSVQVRGCSSFAALLEDVAANPPDTILVDIHIPDAPEGTMVREIRAACPSATVVVLAHSMDIPRLAEALSQGAMGCLPRNSSMELMRRALELVEAGGTYIPASLFMAWKGAQPVAGTGAGVVSPIQGTAPVELTRRQQDVLEGIRSGLSNKEIALRLGMSEGTVKNHVKAVMKALKVRNRTQAALIRMPPVAEMARL